MRNNEDMNAHIDGLTLPKQSAQLLHRKRGSINSQDEERASSLCCSEYVGEEIKLQGIGSYLVGEIFHY